MRINHGDASGRREERAIELVRYARAQVEPRLPSRTIMEQLELPADVFPGYTLVAKASRGGQGHVYQAIDDSTGRQVAIKVLRSGSFGGEAERGRFQREIEILGQLQHPNIVTIHNSGAIDLHRYFVMDYIDGQPLDVFVSGRHLSIDQTLKLFLRICEAVNAAHLKGIVHRDLKPGNIQVDRHHEPHVLDFGLAKAVSDSDVSSLGTGEATMTGQFIGSLPWSSPEQVRNAPGGVDTRTDVYALGLLLYHMLTESMPYERTGNLRDMTGRILGDQPIAPNTLRKEIDDELSTIVLTCLQKEPDRRYQFAGALASDIRRYRAGEPIDAKRNSTVYLLAKALRRHRGVAVLAALFVLMSVGYGIAMSFLYQKATESGRLAEQHANEVAEHFEAARSAIDFLVGEVSNSFNETPGNTRIKNRVLEGAFERLLPLVDRHSDDPQLREALMRTHYQMGDIAIALRRLDVAQLHLQEAMALRMQLFPPELQGPEELSELSIHHVLLGDVARQVGDMEECGRRYAEALLIDEALVEAQPNNAHFLDNLAWSYDRVSQLAEEWANDLQRARDTALEQLRIMERLTEAEPENATRLLGLTAALHRMARLSYRAGEVAEGDRFADRALAISERMVAVAPDDPFILSKYIYVVGHHYSRSSKLTPQERVDGLLRLGKFVTRLLDLEPDVPHSRCTQIVASYQRMIAASSGGEDEQVAAAAREILAGAAAYAELATPDFQIVSRHAAALIHLRDLEVVQGDRAEAMDFHRRACEVVEHGVESGVYAPYDQRIVFLDLRLGDPYITSDQWRDLIVEGRRLRQSIRPSETDSMISLAEVFARWTATELAIETLEFVLDYASDPGETPPSRAVELLRRWQSSAGRQ